MQKKLTKHGNSMALLIEKPILDLLGADAETLFEISTDGQVLILTPLKSEEQNLAFKEALEKTNERYADDLKKLAE